ncbi:MAG: ABC transporter permease [Patescibacteria group bacterium]
MKQFNFNSLQSFIAVALFLLAWQFVSAKGIIDPFFISSPWEILKSDVVLINSGTVLPHLLTSLAELFIGFTLAIAAGVTIALLLGWYEKSYAAFSPFIYGLHAIPYAVLIPLFVIWMGISIWTKITIVFVVVLYPIIITTLSGVRNIDPSYIRLAKSFGAKDATIFKTIILPGSLPYIAAGLRIAIFRALGGVIVSELFVGGKGLGYLISYYGNTFQTSKLFAVIVIIVAISTTFIRALSLIERKLSNWKLSKDRY